jgi:hypothetical protein
VSTNIVPPSILGIRAPGCDIFLAKLSTCRCRGAKPEIHGDGFQALRPGGGRCNRQPNKTKHKKTPPGFTGRGVLGPAGLLAVGLTSAGPDERVTLTVFVLEQVGKDRRVEARVIQLDREIVAPLA